MNNLDVGLDSGVIVTEQRELQTGLIVVMPLKEILSELKRDGLGGNIQREHDKLDNSCLEVLALAQPPILPNCIFVQPALLDERLGLDEVLSTSLRNSY